MWFLRFFLYASSLAVFAALLFGYLGALHPAFDSFAHFRLHFAVLTLILCVPLLFSKGLLGGVAMAVCACLALYTTFYNATGLALAAPGQGALYRHLQINVRFDNPNPKEILRAIAQSKADVVTAQEVTSRWRDEFATISAAYPFQRYCPAHRKIGDVAILSKRPFADSDLNSCGDGQAMMIQAIDFGGQIIHVGSVHLFWPWPHQQPAQILALKPMLETLKSAGTPLLLSGDLNAVRWSYAARSMAAFSNMKLLDYRGGSWLAFEFPSDWTGAIGLPIDNIFVSGVSVKSTIVLPAAGSDHRPLLTEFTLPQPINQAAKEPAAT